MQLARSPCRPLALPCAHSLNVASRQRLDRAWQHRSLHFGSAPKVSCSALLAGSRCRAIISAGLRSPARDLVRGLRWTWLTGRRLSTLLRLTTMRWIIAISLTLVAVGFLAVWINLPGMAGELTNSLIEWRRSVHGWERVSLVTERIADGISNSLAPVSGPHPAIVSLLTGLLSTLSLAAFTPAKRFGPAKTPSKRFGGPITKPNDLCDWVDNPNLK
jgi:hypothetical protein